MTGVNQAKLRRIEKNEKLPAKSTPSSEIIVYLVEQSFMKLEKITMTTVRQYKRKQTRRRAGDVPI